MTTTRAADATSTVDGDLRELACSTEPRRIEELADRVSSTCDRRALRPLLWRLGDSFVRDDPDVEDAVCGALVALGVMRSLGNQRFLFAPRQELTDDVVALVREIDVAIPLRYFFAS